MPVTRLFLDWLHVYRGQMEITLDPERVSSQKSLFNDSLSLVYVSVLR